MNLLDTISKIFQDLQLKANSYPAIYYDEIYDDKYVIHYYNKYDDWGMRKRYSQKMRFGRYLTEFFTYSPAEVTHMCEAFKAFMNVKSGKFEIISGSEISDAYYNKNYYKHCGTLGNSCMRYKKCQDRYYFKVYEDNALMLVMKPKRGKRIMGRALLWKYNDTYLMDRVYTVEPYIEYQFYKFAKENGFGVLKANRYVNSGEVQKWLLPEDNYEEAHSIDVSFDISDKIDNYDYWPYIDSVCYLGKKGGKTTLSTNPLGFDDKSQCYMCHCTYGSSYKIWL